MGFVQGHEAFPNGFEYQYTGSNWLFPSANPWVAADDGGFADEIAQAGVGFTPAILTPQSPLQNTPIYDGAQQNFVDAVGGTPILTWSGTQTHLQDHGTRQ